uniref:Peptidase C1A papain C-terminal domain-containing protein n=1 Tax=viral metagenome TaxID=1070528 RepID=A0A6C0D486_9ZZZZ
MKREYWVAIVLFFSIILTLVIGIYFHNGIEGYSDLKTKWANNLDPAGKTTKDLGMRGSKGTDASNNSDIKYDSNNYNVQYHETPDQLELDDPSTAIDSKGNLYKQSGANPHVETIYYQPGSYLFGASTYVPNYEDSVYLSKLTGESSAKPIVNSAKMASGFCSYNKDSPIKLEEACQATDVNSCSSTSCCVLLGGSKCVSGDATGPYQKQNYGDITIKNPDYYYFQGTCYGNCSANKLNYTPLGPSLTNNILNDSSSQILNGWPTDKGSMSGSSTGSKSWKQNTSIDLGPFFPPIVNQGAVDSAQTYAMIYYIGNFYNVTTALNLIITNVNYGTLYESNSTKVKTFYNASGNIINPLYTFNQVNGDCSTEKKSTWNISDVFNSGQKGCKTMANYPLKYDNPSIDTQKRIFLDCPPTTIGPQNSTPFTGRTMTVLYDRTTGNNNKFNIDAIKYYLNAGTPLLWQINMNLTFETMFSNGKAVNSLTFPQVSDNAIWYNQNLPTDIKKAVSNSNVIGHTMVIVGFADNVVAAKNADNSSGVFKFINQSSSTFGDNGFGYITYNYFFAVNNKSETRFTNGDGPTNSVHVVM